MKREIVLIASGFVLAACVGTIPAQQPTPDLTEIYRNVVQTFEAEAAGTAEAAETQKIGPPPTNTPVPPSTSSAAEAGFPNEILTLQRKGYDFEWNADHWESREMLRGSVFFFYPDGLGEFDEPGFGYTATFDLDEHAMNLARRDFFSAFGFDAGADIWMLQLGEAILSDGESEGKSCRETLCCLFFMPNYPEYRFYCTLN